MDEDLRHDRLATVGALATTLADRMLTERLASGAMPLANANALWAAALLLEEYTRPVPEIVAEVLTQVRHAALAEAA